ncbi:alpha/beta-hydrolase [Calocera viscosa TUFC12733]|uniref:Alpha/beta-hydrolase n=1 Tax=Calocera viscosa (strain TUFC12733) TaxID=1330018 RepID=A0A167JAL7_CALVF|nr:alpha/beta-hydrolase [Calocera viscosa TUFC12733]
MEHFSNFLKHISALVDGLLCRTPLPAEECTPVYLLPRTEVQDLAQARRAILARHVEQLQQPRLLSVLSPAEGHVRERETVELVGISLSASSDAQTATELGQWTSESAAQIDAAKLAYGAKSSPAEVDWNVVRLGLMQSTVMYLRDFESVKSAVTAAPPEAEKAVADSQQAITAIAETWGLSFTVVCDLVDDHPAQHWFWDGPFCGAFYFPSPAPFIVVAFKGTTPSNLGEWLVDMDIAAASAVPDPCASGPGKGKGKGVLWGAEVSRGVAGALFGGYGVKGKGTVPFDLIVMGLQDLASALGGSAEKQVPVYVTGHSLGASYATLFYADALRRFSLPHSRAQPFQLIDLHTFGSPRVALSSFGLSLRSLAAQQEVHVWRVVNEGDLVPSVPPVDALEQAFEHVDAGVLVEKGKKAQGMKSELGRGFPESWLEGGVEEHGVESYWEAVRSAEL